MKKRAIYFIFILYLVIALGGAVFLMNASPKGETDEEFTVRVNRLIRFMESHWNELQKGEAAARSVMTAENLPGFDFTLIGSDGEVLFQTRKDISENISQATTNFDLIRDVEVNGETVGKLLIHNSSADRQAERNRNFALLFFALATVLLVCILCYDHYLQKKVIRPFHDMEDFARQVAMGNLDVPLEMDRENVFGAFTQSFDLMREELKASRLREEAALRSRKELIAQLSHDVKTPVASIKAMADVMELSLAEEEQKKTIQAINAKADQIDRLVSNLFHATLEELEHMEVQVEEVPFDEILRMVREADYRLLVTEPAIPDCVVMADPLRLSQVIGNVISNSYKYAGTAITVKGIFETIAEKKYLTVEFCDQGGGVPEAELDLILEKFKRGSNSAGKDGAGLGLYISSCLMEKMGGSIQCSNKNGGFAVTLRLLLA